MERQTAMPAFMEKLRRAAEQEGAGVVYRSDDELTESKFTSYWLFTAWSVSLFNVLSMGVVVVHMSTGTFAYAWLPHLAGTAIINSAIGFMAIVYRFVLFPASPRPTQLSFEGDGFPRTPHHEARYNGPYPSPNGDGTFHYPNHPAAYPNPPPVPNGTGSPGGLMGSSGGSAG